MTKKLLGKMNGELYWFGYYDIRCLTLFVHKFSPVGQICTLFKKQRGFFPCKANHFSFIVNLFVSFRSPVCVFLLVFSTVSVWIFLNTS